MKKIFVLFAFLFLVGCSNSSIPAGPSGNVFEYSLKQGVLQSTPDSSCYSDSSISSGSLNWNVVLEYSMEGVSYVLDYSSIQIGLDHYPLTAADSVNYDAKWKRYGYWHDNKVRFVGVGRGTKYKIYYIP